MENLQPTFEYMEQHINFDIPLEYGPEDFDYDSVMNKTLDELFNEPEAGSGSESQPQDIVMSDQDASDVTKVKSSINDAPSLDNHQILQDPPILMLPSLQKDSHSQDQIHIENVADEDDVGQFMVPIEDTDMQLDITGDDQLYDFEIPDTGEFQPGADENFSKQTDSIMADGEFQEVPEPIIQATVAPFDVLLQSAPQLQQPKTNEELLDLSFDWDDALDWGSERLGTSIPANQGDSQPKEASYPTVTGQQPRNQSPFDDDYVPSDGYQVTGLQVPNTDRQLRSSTLNQSKKRKISSEDSSYSEGAKRLITKRRRLAALPVDAKTGNCRSTNIAKTLEGARENYEPLPDAPEPWDTFEYNSFGELADFYSEKQILKFLYNHPLRNKLRTDEGQKKKKLRVWIQRGPADSRRRQPTQFSTSCRFKRCFMNDRKIEVGHPRLAFDEQTNGNSKFDPYINAGYVHLHCAEAFFDFPQLVKDLKIRVDDRSFRYDPVNHCKFDVPLFAAACEFVDGCMGRKEFPANYPLASKYTDGETKPYKGTLCHRLWRSKKENEAPNRAEVRLSRGEKPTMWHKHMGDLRKLQNAKTEQAMERKQRARQRKAEVRKARKEARNQRRLSSDSSD